MTDSDLTARDIALQVLDILGPDAKKAEWGKEMLDLLLMHSTPQLRQWLHDRQVTTLGTYVAGVKAAVEAAKKKEKLIEMGYNGTALSPTISIHAKEGGRQLRLWTEVPPALFIEAVMRQRTVIRGLAKSNKLREDIVDDILTDPELASLPTLGDVCNALNIDPDLLGLDELGEAV